MLTYKTFKGMEISGLLKKYWREFVSFCAFFDEHFLSRNSISVTKSFNINRGILEFFKVEFSYLTSNLKLENLTNIILSVYCLCKKVIERILIPVVSEFV